MANKGTAIIRVKPNVPALKPASAGLNAAVGDLDQALVPLKQFQGLLDFANKGGRAACWGLIGSAAAVSIGLAAHAAALAYFGPVGMLVGVGIYGTRIFHRIKDPDLAKLNERISDLNILLARGKITQDFYDQAYKKALADSGLIERPGATK